MDINLTTPLFANVRLEQSWIVVFLNFAAGLIGAAIGASAVLYAQKMNLEKAKENVQREERKQAYIKFTKFVNNWVLYDNFDRDQFSGCISELTLAGNTNIINKLVDIFKEGNIYGRKKHIIREYYNSVIPLMRQNFSGINEEIQINISEWLDIKI
jgi:hypothetical protein